MNCWCPAGQDEGRMPSAVHQPLPVLKNCLQVHFSERLRDESQRKETQNPLAWFHCWHLCSVKDKRSLGSTETGVGTQTARMLKLKTGTDVTSQLGSLKE
ncbi:hypothetical protein FQA47_000196 [Oryzias melastigma]|uniref:Uncharacterized protein n=1 Tax=Oryzias melastigma TaxID=30732 RepID=A0A834C4S6_ORYME|nr:hypothetical protein FQA47_000196 [Oryzias melastigma]